MWVQQNYCRVWRLQCTYVQQSCAQGPPQRAIVVVVVVVIINPQGRGLDPDPQQAEGSLFLAPHSAMGSKKILWFRNLPEWWGCLPLDEESLATWVLIWIIGATHLYALLCNMRCLESIGVAAFERSFGSTQCDSGIWDTYRVLNVIVQYVSFKQLCVYFYFSCGKEKADSGGHNG